MTIEFSGFPNFRPQPPYLQEQLPAGWKSSWHKRDMWRNHPFFSLRNRLKRVFPGFLSGLGMFGVYLCYDHWNNTQGSQADENKRLEKFMAEREKRLAEQGIHLGHH